MPSEHKPTDLNRGLVMAWSQCGVTQGTMATLLKIDEKTLRKHYEKELSQKGMSVAKVAGKLFLQAMSGDFQAQKFYLQAQGKWKTKHELEVKGKMTLADLITSCEGELGDDKIAMQPDGE